MLEDACSQLLRWSLEHPRADDLLMCVNVSHRDLSRSGG
jgi:hypothetical protein